MSNMINLGINEEMVKPILEKQIQAAILANIGNPEALIARAVSVALSQKVDRNGNVSQYSSDNRFDFLDTLTNNAIRRAAKEAIEEWLKENATVVKAKVMEELDTPGRRNSIAKAFADELEKSLSCNWRFDCNISLKERKED